MGSKYTIGPATQCIKTLARIGILMDGQPLSGAAAAFGAPFLMPGYFGVEDKKVLYADCVTGTHDGGDIVRVKDILQYDGQVFLSFVQHAGDPLFSFRGHSWSGKAQNYVKGPCTGNRN